MEVPNSLKRLVRLVMRGFYGIEHVLVMDILIRKPCMKEEDLSDLLKFEKKQLSRVIAQLKVDKMLKVKLKLEAAEGRTTKQNYYYINYKAFVNVVKYKLDHMRRKIETEERDNTSRASFVCTECTKTFTDLEANQLCDMLTGEFKCNYCGAIVDEDPSVKPQKDSRRVLAHFNEQIEPLYLLLKEVEDIILPSEILEPEPLDLNAGNRSQIQATHSIIDGQAKWRESSGRTAQYDAELLAQSNMTVKIEANTNESVAASEQARFVKEEVDEHAARVKKEQPAWMTASTIFTEASGSTVVVKKEKENTSSNISLANAEDSVGSSKEILEALLVHEKAQDNNKSALSFLQTPNFGNEESIDFENDDELMESDEEDMDDSNTVYVSVGGQAVPFNDLGDEHIAKMTPSEREEYVKITKDMYEHIFD